MKRPVKSQLFKLEIVAIVACLIAILTAIGILIYYTVFQMRERSFETSEILIETTSQTEAEQSVTESTERLDGVVPHDPASPIEDLEQEEQTVVETEPTDSEAETTDPGPYNSETWTLDLTNDEIYLFATAIWLEGRGETSECQKGIGSVILNRMMTRDLSLKEILYEYNNGVYQFSVAPRLSYSSPDDKSLASATDLVVFGPSMPRCVTYFRASYYHDWSSLIQPYCSIDNTYFSHDIRLCEKEGGCQYEQEE